MIVLGSIINQSLNQIFSKNQKQLGQQAFCFSLIAGTYLYYVKTFNVALFTPIDCSLFAATEIF